MRSLHIFKKVYDYMHFSLRGQGAELSYVYVLKDLKKELVSPWDCQEFKSKCWREER